MVPVDLCNPILDSSMPLAPDFLRIIPSPFYDGPDGEPDWAPAFLAGEHPWQQRLAPFAGMFHQYETNQMLDDIMRLARSMVEPVGDGNRGYGTVFRIAYPPATDDRRSSLMNPDVEPSLCLDADLERRQSAPSSLTPATTRPRMATWFAALAQGPLFAMPLKRRAGARI